MRIAAHSGEADARPRKQDEDSRRNHRKQCRAVATARERPQEQRPEEEFQGNDKCQRAGQDDRLDGKDVGQGAVG